MSRRFSSWEEVTSAARSEPDLGPSLLSAVCVAGLPFVLASVNRDRLGGFPRGGPPKEVVRDAATLLCEITDGRTDDMSRARHALGLISRLNQPQRAEEDAQGDNEFAQRLRDCDTAVDEAAAASDKLIMAICANQRGTVLKSLARIKDAVVSHQYAVQALDDGALFSADHWLYADAPFLVSDTAPGIGYKVKFRAKLNTVRRLLSVPDNNAAKAVVLDLVEFADRHKDVAINNLGWALVTRARVERAARDTGAFLATEAELQVLAAAAEVDGPMVRYWLTSVADNASHLKDFGRVEWAARQRIAARARQVLTFDIDEFRADASTYTELVGRARTVGSRNSLSNLGNACYDIAKAQYFGGSLDQDAEAQAEALRLLGVADYAWEGFKDNGIHALRLMRGLITLLAEDPPLDELTATFVAVTREATNENTARRALVAAVRSGVVGSSVVRDRLDELLGSVDPVQAAGEFAVLSGLSAEWWYRVNAAGGASGQGLDWESGEQTALDAVTLIRPAGVSLDPDLEATCWHSAALSLAATGGSAVEQLERLLWAVRCVAELMVTVSTGADRARHADNFEAVFRSAAELALALADHAAADVIMEAARRDRVGLLLAELARNPDVDVAIRSAALAVADSTSTTPNVVAGSSSEDDDEGQNPKPPSIGERSATILVDRHSALSNAERVLGPLGALCDAAALMSVSAAAVLDQRSRETTTAVLQLMPQRNTERSGGDVRIYRRLTWITADSPETSEHLDSIDVPAHLLALWAGHPNTFAWSDHYAKVVLPQPLLDLLGRVDESSPVRLMIVPTGLFFVPLDSLPLPTANGRMAETMLIDRAIVSVHGSLTSMLALMQIETTPSVIPSIAVYGGVGLDHIEAEYQSLSSHLSGVTRVHGSDELFSHLCDNAEREPLAMLAMGVHGTDDAHGWGQGKQMPDGSIVTAAQALRWNVPRLCVLASCHSAITTADGVELGGFPLALMLRGAVTVVGGLYAINDEATTQIMSYFWEQYAAGTPALEALHKAKHHWLQSDPERRDDPSKWAGLIAYGAATE